MGALADGIRDVYRRYDDRVSSQRGETGGLCQRSGESSEPVISLLFADAKAVNLLIYRHV